MVNLKKITKFDWDEGNLDKSYQKHGIAPNEAEEVFTDESVGIEKDIKHQETEERFIAIGETLQEKLLFVVFTIRNDAIRVISARQANKKEGRSYEKAKKNP